MVFGSTFATPEGRFVWTQHLSVPKDAPPAKEGEAPGKPRYEITLLIPKNGAKTEEFMKNLKADTDAAIELFNKGRSATIGNCLLFGKYGDGDTQDLEKYPYYKNCWVITARNAEKIADKDVMDSKKQPFVRENIKGGMLGRLVVQTIITGHGISYKMQAIQVTNDDGVRFGGASRDHGDMLDDMCGESACDTETTTEVVPAQTEDKKPTKATKAKEAAVNLLA